MEQKRITEEAIQAFRQYLIRDEKSAVTVEKYLRDVRAFQAFIGETPVEKELVIHYKNHLLEESYAVRSINSMLASVNSFLIFMDWPDCKVKSLKVQRQVYCAEEKELTKAEYERLLKAAGKNEQLRLVMETISYATLELYEGIDWKQDALLSLAGVFAPKRPGVTPVALSRFLNENPKITTLRLHLDNDAVGRAAATGMMDGLPGFTVLDEPPICGKDVNEQLQLQVGRIKKKEEQER